jgi:hypothetical protein
MTGVGVLTIADIVLRQTHHGSALHTPSGVLALTLVTRAMTVLGGKLVYRAGLGVGPVISAADRSRAAVDHPGRRSVSDADA